MRLFHFKVGITCSSLRGDDSLKNCQKAINWLGMPLLNCLCNLWPPIFMWTIASSTKVRDNIPHSFSDLWYSMLMRFISYSTGNALVHTHILILSPTCLCRIWSFFSRHKIFCRTLSLPLYPHYRCLRRPLPSQWTCA